MQNVDVSKFFKPGNAYQPLLNLAVQVMEQHPEILPAVFNKEELKKDSELCTALGPIALRIAALYRNAKNTDCRGQIP